MGDPVEDPETDPVEDPEADPEPFDEGRAKAKIAKANNEAKALRARLKAAEEKAARLDELEEGNKTETEKAAERARSLEERAARAESDLLRLRVATRKGLTEAQARRLVGDTEEELEADADELVTSFAAPDGTPPPARPPGGKPAESLRGGGDPTVEPEETDPRKIAATVTRRY